jgi:Tfp pilus assembly protein PilX
MSAMRLIYGNEKGMVLPLGLMFLAIIALLGTTAVVVTTTDLKIGSNYKTSEQAFYAAEAGVSEALYRLSLFDDGGTSAPPSGSMININGLTDNNAAISIDPNGLLSNNIDDDSNGAVDDISDLNYNGTYDNRNWQTKILLKTSDDTDTTTTVYTPTIQPSGNWIEYSASTDDGTALTIEFRKDTGDMDGDGNTSEIVFYNESLVTPLNVDTTATPASGQPVVAITSTGKADGAIKRLKVTAVHQPVDIDAKSAVMVNLSPTISGSAIISGFNYDGATTSADCSGSCGASAWDAVATFKTNGIDNHGGTEKYTYTNPSPPPATKHKNWNDQDVNLFPVTPAPPNSEEELGTEADIPYGTKLEASGHKPGVWTPLASGTVSPNADVFGGNDTTPWKVEAAPAWLTLAEALGVSQDVLDRILERANVTEADMDGSGTLRVAPQGVMYINNAGSNELKITSSTPDNDKGWGLMYVTGDVDFKNFEFKGLIYVKGDAQITGTFWLMGCMAIKGVTSGNFSSGNGTFLYSSDALDKYVNKGMKFVTLSWYDDLS